MPATALNALQSCEIPCFNILDIYSILKRKYSILKKADQVSGEESRALRSKHLPLCLVFNFRVGFSPSNITRLPHLWILSELSILIHKLSFYFLFPSLSPAINCQICSNNKVDGHCRASGIGSGGRPGKSPKIWGNFHLLQEKSKSIPCLLLAELRGWCYWSFSVSKYFYLLNFHYWCSV